MVACLAVLSIPDLLPCKFDCVNSHQTFKCASKVFLINHVQCRHFFTHRILSGKIIILARKWYHFIRNRWCSEKKKAEKKERKKPKIQVTGKSSTSQIWTLNRHHACTKVSEKGLLVLPISCFVSRLLFVWLAGCLLAGLITEKACSLPSGWLSAN